MVEWFVGIAQGAAFQEVRLPFQSPWGLGLRVVSMVVVGCQACLISMRLPEI